MNNVMYQVEGETNPVAKCRVSKTLCHDQPAAAKGRQSSSCRAPRAVPQRVPLGRASVTRCAAWSGRLDPLPAQNKTDVPKGRGNRTAKTNKSTNELTNLQMRREGGSHCGRCVCDVGAGGPLQSLVTLIS